MNRKTEFIHRINDEDRIVEINRDWEDFAWRNWPEYDPSTIVGNKIWKFITDSEVSHLYYEILHMTRMHNKIFQFNYRCDSPDTFRLLRMTISITEKDLVEFRSTVQKEIIRPPIDVLNLNISSNNIWIMMCSFCKAVHAQGVWIEFEKAVDALNLQIPPYPKISHGICDSCSAGVRRDLIRAFNPDSNRSSESIYD